MDIAAHDDVASSIAAKDGGMSLRRNDASQFASVKTPRATNGGGSFGYERITQ
jgi:hypothetical protein